jgi:hypothetical protein
MNSTDLIYAPIQNNSYNILPGQTEIRVPQGWLDVLSKIQNEWPVATIAGGALRDLDLGRPIKDVDVFIPYSVDSFSRLAKMMKSNFNVYVDKIEHEMGGICSRLAVGAQAPSHFIFYYHGWKFEVTQKLEAYQQNTIIDSFDLGICMICLVNGNIYRSPHYITDVTNKTMTVIHDTGGQEHTHANRIEYKYRGWTFIPKP